MGRHLLVFHDHDHYRLGNTAPHDWGTHHSDGLRGGRPLVYRLSDRRNRTALYRASVPRGSVGCRRGRGRYRYPPRHRHERASGNSERTPAQESGLGDQFPDERERPAKPPQLIALERIYAPIIWLFRDSEGNRNTIPTSSFRIYALSIKQPYLKITWNHYGGCGVGNSFDFSSSCSHEHIVAPLLASYAEPGSLLP